MLKDIRVAYLMHVSWDWIKQRPHFIYEELTRYCHVDLYYIEKLIDRHKNKIVNSRNVYNSSKINKIIKVPYSGKFRFLRYFETLINGNLSLKDYDVIWITSPILLNFISDKELAGKRIIYDCMDDFLEFYSEPQKIKVMRSLETELIRKSDRVIASSAYISEKIKSMYNDTLRNNPVVINNGISSSLVDRIYTSRASKEEEIHKIDDSSLNLTYIGTIGSWMDFELLLQILNSYDNIIITMVGPIDAKAPFHERLRFVGMVEHDRIPNYAQKADALIMPFRVSELVRSVDPVKIYEYILFRKPILAVKYGEMNKFLPFVSLYSNFDDIQNLLKLLTESRLQVHSVEETEQFIENSTWYQRCGEIIKIIEEIAQ